MKHKKQISLIILLLLFFSFHIYAQTTWYVNNEVGSDEYNGRSLTVDSDSVGPKKTISSAIFSAANQDTILIASTGIAYGPETSEPDTIVVSKELVFKSIGGAININSNLEINAADSGTLGKGVEILSQFHLQNDLSIYSNITLKDTMKLDGNLIIGSASDSLEIGILTFFYSPLLFSGEDDQIITVPEEGAGFGTFEINKPLGNVMLEGGDLDLSVEVSDTTIKNVVTFTKGLFITGNNKLILKAPAGTDELGFIHNSVPGDISHVVGTVGINPKLGTLLKNAKTIWPIGSVVHYRSFAMIIFQPFEQNLGLDIYASYLDEKPTWAEGLSINYREKLITYYPDFYWDLSVERGVSPSSLGYDLEFTIEGFTDFINLNDIVVIKKGKSVFSPDFIWSVQAWDYENKFEEEIPVIKCISTIGAFIQNNISTITLGFPTNLYLVNELPDLLFDELGPDNKKTINLENVFGGNKGQLAYHVSITREGIIYIPSEDFTENNFDIIGLSNGFTDVIVTATDINGDFISDTCNVDVFPTGTESENIIPHEFTLYQNYPNPFNPTTTIRFGLPEAARVLLKIYNSLGEEVVTIINNEELAAGYHSYNFNAEELSSGVYYYRIDADNFHEVRKMILVK